MGQGRARVGRDRRLTSAIPAGFAARETQKNRLGAVFFALGILLEGGRSWFDKLTTNGSSQAHHERLLPGRPG